MDVKDTKKGKKKEDLTFLGRRGRREGEGKEALGFMF